MSRAIDEQPDFALISLDKGTTSGMVCPGELTRSSPLNEIMTLFSGFQDRIQFAAR